MVSVTYAQKNNFKVNLVPAVWGEIRLGYERVLGENQSFQLNFGMMVPHELPTFIYDEADVEDYGGTADLQNKISGFSVSGEYRFYTSSSKDAPRGFYVAPFLKYNKYKIETSAGFGYEATVEEYLDLTPEQQETATFNGLGYDLDVTGNFDAELRQMGLGLMIGYQWLIADRISIDWTFFGLGVDSYLFEVDISTEEIDVDYQEWGNEIEEEVKEFDYIGDKTDVTVYSDKVSVKAPFVLPNFKFAFVYWSCFLKVKFNALS